MFRSLNKKKKQAERLTLNQRQAEASGAGSEISNTRTSSVTQETKWSPFNHGWTDWKTHSFPKWSE